MKTFNYFLERNCIASIFYFKKITHFRDSSSSAFIKKLLIKIIIFINTLNSGWKFWILLFEKHIFTPNSECDFFKISKKTSEYVFCKIMVLREIALSLGGGQIFRPWFFTFWKKRIFISCLNNCRQDKKKTRFFFQKSLPEKLTPPWVRFWGGLVQTYHMIAQHYSKTTECSVQIQFLCR